jgi:hypothetical protein
MRERWERETVILARRVGEKRANVWDKRKPRYCEQHLYPTHSTERVQFHDTQNAIEWGPRAEL